MDYTWADIDRESNYSGIRYVDDWIRERMEEGKTSDEVAEEALREYTDCENAIKRMEAEIEAIRNAMADVEEERRFYRDASRLLDPFVD